MSQAPASSLTLKERAFLEESLGALEPAEGDGRRVSRRIPSLEDESHLVPLLIEGFRSGLFRRVGGLEGERIAFEVYRKTTVGQVMAKILGAANQVLGGLDGRVIQEISCSIPHYGVAHVTIRTDGGVVILEIDECGARLLRARP